MSDESTDGELSSSSSSPEKRRSTVPNILPHQRSFEKRYSHMIHKQILETGVNKEALQRQINAYFSCGGSKANNSSSSVAAAAAAEDDLNASTPTSADGATKMEENSAEEVNKVERSKRSLDKAETIDVAEMEGA